MADATTDAAIAKAWPERWAKAQTKRGGRNKVRKAWASKQRMDALRARFARCKNCGHYDAERRSCDYHSDGVWTQQAEPNGLCVDWAEIARAAAE